MKKLVSHRLSAPLVFGLLLRGAAAGAGQPGSSRSPRPRHRGRASRGGLTTQSFAVAARVLLACAPLPAADLIVQGANSPYSFTSVGVYNNIYVGQSADGTLNQSGGTLYQEDISHDPNPPARPP